MKTRTTRDGRRIPNSISIELSSVCNRKCPWCPVSLYQRQFGELPIELLHKIVDELAAENLNVPLELHFFNEPLLYFSRLIECISYAKSKLPGNEISFNTNGDLLTMEYWTELRKAGLTSIKVMQYDGPVASKEILELQSKLSPEDARIFTIRMFWGRHKCNRGGLLPWQNHKLPRKRPCERTRQVCINYKGDAVLCCCDYFGQVVVGNVANKTIMELHNDPLICHYREELNKGNRAAFVPCDSCDISN